MKAIPLTPTERQQLRHAAAVRRLDGGGLLELTERDDDLTGGQRVQGAAASLRSVSSTKGGASCAASSFASDSTRPGRPDPQDQAPAGPSLASIDPVLDLPEAQPIIRRLLEAAGDGHSKRVDVYEHVLRVAALVVKAKKHPLNQYARPTL